MLDVLTAEDVRRIDAACEARGISTETLMRNAGYAVAAAARRLLGGAYCKRVVVVCGKGNNAGDGLVAGRVLSSWGASVTAVLTLGDDFKGAAKTALERFPGRRVAPSQLEHELGRADLVIDAIFGVGLSRPPEGDAVRAIGRLGLGLVPVVAVDIPSGIDADTGRFVGTGAVWASITVTLDGPKPGLYFEPGRSCAGSIEVADITVPAELHPELVRALEQRDAGMALPMRRGATNKRNVGTVLLVVGSRALPGAAALTAGAAVHAGAGLTVVAAPESVVPTIIGRVPEVTAIPLPETGDGTIDLKALEVIVPRLSEFHVVAIGPGLSRHPGSLELVKALVREIELPLVLDADGLSAFKGEQDLLSAHRAPLVITPHAAELSRIIGRSVEEINADRLRVSRDAAASLKGVVLLKGPGTVIADPAGRAFITTTGGPALSQGGTGDVLTGITAALLAQEREIGERRSELLTVAAAAWIHGRAGDRIAERVAPHPASPSMLIEELPAVLHEVAG